MSHPVPSPTIKEQPFQIFVYGRYVERDGNKPLTPMQSRVRSAVRRYDGNMGKAAEHLGVGRQCIQGHVSLIESKGWDC